MILLDPDLDPDPVRDAARTRRSVASKRQSSSIAHRVPSVQTLARFLSRAQSAVKLRGHVSVMLTTDKAIRRLNRDFRGMDKATDVLSFPADALMGRRQNIAGDLAISVPTARRQSIEQGHALGTELKVLMLHGVLHLAGYDHESDSGEMARRERALRTKLGLPQGLIERVEHRVPRVSGRPGALLLEPSRQRRKR